MKQVLFSLAACLCVLAVNALPSNAQFPSTQSQQEASRVSDSFSAPFGNERDIRSESESERVREPNQPDPYQESDFALGQLASAQSDKEKSKAKEALSKALSACFDLDIKNRESELESIRNRLSKMEAQLKKRVDGKDEIVQLRLQVLANNASGLGWSEAPRNQRLGQPFQPLRFSPDHPNRRADELLRSRQRSQPTPSGRLQN